MSDLGASAALRGYRVQALYTLRRILTQGSDRKIFRPEGTEDLDVYSADDQLEELIQVKSYSPLQLSALSPEKDNSFLHRAVQRLKQTNSPSIKLINYGEIGPELDGAWTGEPKARHSVTGKLSKCGFQKSDIDLIFSGVALVTVDENKEEADVLALISEILTGFDQNNTLNLLQYWLLLMAEKKQILTYSNVIEKIQEIGRFLSQRRDYLNQWYTTIDPLEDQLITDQLRVSLVQEFYEGGFTRYEHILANLDFKREAKLTRVRQAFKKNNVVIVRAASGQGKTTLAYRYLYDNYPNTWRFCIKRIENIQHALSIANALGGHATALQAPVAVYIDVHPRDDAWIELARQLARHQYIHVLVTIREEDFRRANTASMEFKPEEIDLEFNKQEAEYIYWTATGASRQTRYLDFEAAWDAFREDGPLMEFIYLLTQTETLEQRLAGQIHEIYREIEKGARPDKLYVLQLVSVASAYEARLDTQKLIDYLQLTIPEHTINALEKEYLIRRSDDKRYIQGLHAIRSTILVKLLTSEDITPWLSLANQVLPLLLEEDLESFILYTLVDRPGTNEQFTKAVIELTPQTWRGIAGVLRGLLWASNRAHVKSNQAVNNEAKEEFGPAWPFIYMLSLAEDDEKRVKEWQESFAQIFSENQVKRMNEIRVKQTPKSETTKDITYWLGQLKDEPDYPQNMSDWSGMAEVFYWANYYKINNFADWLSDDELNSATNVLSLFVLADLAVALYLYHPQKYQTWLKQNRVTLETRLADEYSILKLVEDDDLLVTHFIPSLDTKSGIQESSSKKEDVLHRSAMERIELVRRLFPYYEKYGAQGYGHRLVGKLELPGDSTVKSGVIKKYLPLDWATRNNHISSNLALYDHRLEIWGEYIEQIFEIRQAIIVCISQLRQGLGQYLARKQPIKISEGYLREADWKKCIKLISRSPDLPKVAVDRWGFSYEKSNKIVYTLEQQKYLPSSIALRKYEPFLDAQREYFSSIHNFLWQVKHVVVTNFHLNKHSYSLNKEEIIEALQKNNIRIDLSHISSRNLWQAKVQLFEYHKLFRQLFGYIVDEEVLANLEKQEIDLLSHTWQLWYFYAYTPDQILDKPFRDAPKKASSVKNDLEKRAHRALKQGLAPDAEATVMSSKIRWENAPTLWIRMDLKNPLKYYLALEVIVMNLRQDFEAITFQDLAYYLIEENYQNIVIVPVIRGRMLNTLGWSLHTASTIFSKKSIEEQYWSYVQKELPQEILAEQGITLWDHLDLDLIHKFFVSISALIFLVSHLGDFDKLDLEEGPGLEMFKRHLEECSAELSNTLQALIDAGAALVDRFNSLSDTEKQDRPALQEAVATLAHISERMLPPSEEDKIKLSINELRDYAKGLTGLIQYTEAIRLLWVTDVLDHLLDGVS